MKQPIRFFSIGLFTSAIILLGFYIFIENNSSNAIENTPIDDLISKVESDGYRVITEEEFISYSLHSDALKEKELKSSQEKKENDKKENNAKEQEKTKATNNDTDEKSNNNNEDQEKDEKEVKKVVFTTESGVVSHDIAKILVDNGIIDDRQKFVEYLENNNYSPYIQIGKFEVTSEMSLKEIAETITTYPGN